MNYGDNLRSRNIRKSPTVDAATPRPATELICAQSLLKHALLLLLLSSFNAQFIEN